MHSFYRSERIELKNGQLVRIITATANTKQHHKSLDVCRYWEDGKVEIRNIDFTYGGMGWLFDPPDEIYIDGNGKKRKVGVCPWQRIDRHHNITGNLCFDRFVYSHDHGPILEKYPEFKWVLKKATIPTCELFQVIKIWKQYPSQVEALLSAGHHKLAINRQTFDAKDKAAIINWCRCHEGADETLVNIRRMIKYGISPEMIRHCIDRNKRSKVKVTFGDYAHYKEDFDFSIWRDYLDMAQKAGHDVNDPYWRFPKEIRKAHDKVQRQCAAIERAKILAENKKIDAGIRKATEKMFTNVLKTGDIKVYIPRNMDAIRKQAEILNQCLVTAEYYKRIIDRSTVLVFIAKEGEPYATAELVRHGRKYKLGQFYGDENDRNDCLAKDDAKIALDQWAKKFKVRMAA